MRYGIAYLLGVPLSVVAVWYMISHLLWDLGIGQG